MTLQRNKGVPIITVVQPWHIIVKIGGTQVSLAVRPADEASVAAEHYERLPVFDAALPPWRKGERLRGVVTEETTAMGALVPA